MKFDLFNNGDEFYCKLIQDLETAKKTVSVDMYKFNLDKAGLKIANKLIEISKRGIKVSLLIDGIGSNNWGGEIVSLMIKNGIKAKIYHPIPWQLHKLKHAVCKKTYLSKLFYLIAKINTRNHRKSIIIDQNIVYIGSINISSEHLSKESCEAWNDCTVRIVDKKHAKSANIAFKRAFAPDIKNIYQGIQNTLTKKSNILLNNNILARKQNFKKLLKSIKQSKTRIWIATAYFNPKNTLIRALKDAAKKGVEVTIMIPSRSDIPISTLAAKYYYNDLISSGIKILEYLPTMMHAKYMVIDNTIIIGSSNFNHRSFLHDLEIDLKSKDAQMHSMICKKFTNDALKCQEIKNYNYVNKYLSTILQLFKIIL